MTAQALQHLMTCMEEQVTVMQDLTALSQKKSQVLLDGTLPDLDVILKGEQALIWQLGRLEERRFQAQVALARQLGIHPTQLTLDYLVTRIDREEGDKCEQIARQYAAAARELSTFNEHNTELIQQAMAYVDFSLQALGAGGQGSGQVYSPKGQRPGEGKLKRLDSKA